jgi:hypothetical protein
MGDTLGGYRPLPAAALVLGLTPPGQNLLVLLRCWGGNPTPGLDRAAVGGFQPPPWPASGCCCWLAGLSIQAKQSIKQQINLITIQTISQSTNCNHMLRTGGVNPPRLTAAAAAGVR